MNQETQESICRWRSKSGDLSAHQDELSQFAKTAEPAAVVDLFVYLAGNAERSESEWREEFETVFPAQAEALPELFDADQ